MDFSRDPAEQALHDRILAFYRGRGRDRDPDAAAAPERREQGFPREQWEACASLGLLGLPVSPEYGGGGASCAATAYALEAFGYGCVDAGLVFAACAHLLASIVPIAAVASDDLKRRYLPDLVSGRTIAAAGMTEAATGSDVFAMATTAVKGGDHYVITGEKAFITNAPIADVLVIYAVTNPTHGYWRSSAFLVDASLPGVELGAAEAKIGLHSASVGSLRLDGVRVPASCLVGREGQGAAVFERAMRWERSCLFAAWVGLMQRQLERCIETARSTARFGKPIGKHQSIAFRLADMKLRLEASRLLLYRACWHVDRGDVTRLDVALAKLAISEAAISSSLDAIQIHGGRGILEAGGIEAQLRDMIPGAIYSGNSEMQREIIAAELGL